MGERTGYEPGTFCWADVTTNDQEGAKSFYGGLFGWEADDRPVGDDVYYSMMRLDGKDVAAISPQPPGQREAGIPPLWNSYVSVDSADSAAEKAEELGGQVHAQPFDVMDAGRMAVLRDPQGAFFMVWEPRENFGAALVNGHGALSWNELVTPDPKAAADFYRRLFGWAAKPVQGSEKAYLSIKNGNTYNGGIRELDVEGVPAHWTVYFGIDDLDAGLSRVEELGGRRLSGQIDLPTATIAAVQDPQGAPFVLYAGRFAP